MKQAVKLLVSAVICGLVIHTNWFGILSPYLSESVDSEPSSATSVDSGTVQTESASEVMERDGKASESALNTDFILCEVGLLREEIASEITALRNKLEQRGSEVSAADADFVLLSLGFLSQLSEVTKRLTVLEETFGSAVVEIRDRAPPPELARIASDLEDLRKGLDQFAKAQEQQALLEERLRELEEAENGKPSTFNLLAEARAEREVSEQLERQVRYIAEQLESLTLLEERIVGIVAGQMGELERVFQEAIVRSQQTEHTQTQETERKEVGKELWEQAGYGSYEAYILRPPDSEDTLWTVRLSHPEMPEDLVFPNTPSRGNEEDGYIFWVRGEWRSWPTFQISISNPKPNQGK